MERIVMNKVNLYWPVYKNLEKEVLELSYYIHFCDEQIELFSIKIAELLLRCAVEVESIVKSLYSDEGGNMKPLDGDGKERYLNYDFDCLKLLDQKWRLGKRQVLLATPSMYFIKNENRIFSPLKNAHKGEAVWQKAYQAVKHSRVENLNKANIRMLLRVMAALYLLNLYYRNDMFEFETQSEMKNNFDPSIQSDLFSVKYTFLTSFPYSENSLDEFMDSTYIGIFNEAYYNELEDEYKKMNNNVIEHAIKMIAQKPGEYIDLSKLQANKSVWDIAFDKTSDSGNQIPNLVGGFGRKLMAAKYGVVLNKNQDLVSRQ